MAATMTPADLPAAPRADHVEATPNLAKEPHRRVGRRNADVLGLAWLHGMLHAGVYRRQIVTRTWASPTPIQSLEDFGAALDGALEALRFVGTEVFLILEHDQFVHQAEQAPAFSESAIRAYLKGRVQRYEKEREPVLWISQRTVSVRQDAAFLLHMLPTPFYSRLSSILLARRLDLTRILPLVVPLQLAIQHASASKDQMVLVAAEAGEATTIMVTRGDGELLFARTMLGRWASDPARIAGEVNRSLLYAKQQFGALIERIELVGPVNEQVKAEVQSKCGPDKTITLHPIQVQDWLQAVARLTPRHPVNLVVGNLSRKRRRQFLRRVLLATCWLGLGGMILNLWTEEQTLNADRVRTAEMTAQVPAWTVERDRLRARNQDLARYRSVVRQVSEDRLPPVALRFLTYIASIRPADTQFTEYQARWDMATGRWSFQLEGQIEGDEETARESLARFQRQMEKGVLRARCKDGTRVLIAMPLATPDTPPSFRFILAGGLFEN